MQGINAVTCPICLNPWESWKDSDKYRDDSLFECFKCNAIYDKTIERFHKTFPDGRRILWNEDQCRLIIGGRGWNLPWLHYDVTPEQLNLYLTFS